MGASSTSDVHLSMVIVFEGIRVYQSQVPGFDLADMRYKKRATPESSTERKMAVREVIVV